MNPVSFVISRDRAPVPTVPYRMVEDDCSLERIGHGWRYGAIAVVQAVGADAWALVLQPSGRPIARVQDGRVARAIGMMAATWNWPADGATPPDTVAAWAAIAADLQFENLL